MDFHVGEQFFDRCHNAEVGDDHGVDARVRDIREEFAQQVVFIPVRHGIDGQIDFFLTRVCVIDGAVQLVDCEIVGGGAHAEQLTGKVDGIRAVAQCRFHFFKIACGG